MSSKDGVHWLQLALWVTEKESIHSGACRHGWPSPDLRGSVALPSWLWGAPVLASVSPQEDGVAIKAELLRLACSDVASPATVIEIHKLLHGPGK